MANPVDNVPEEMLSCAKLIGMDTEAGSHEFMLPEYMEEAARPDCSFSAEELEWMHRVLDLCQACLTPTISLFTRSLIVFCR